MPRIKAKAKFVDRQHLLDEKLQLKKAKRLLDAELLWFGLFSQNLCYHLKQLEKYILAWKEG